MSSTASLLQSPLPTQSLCPAAASAARGSLEHLPGASPGRARSVPAASWCPADQVGFLYSGPRTKPLLAKKNRFLFSSSSSPGSFPHSGGGCAGAAAQIPGRAAPRRGHPCPAPASSHPLSPPLVASGAPRHQRLAPQGVPGVRAPSGVPRSRPGTHAAGEASAAPGRQLRAGTRRRGPGPPGGAPSQTQSPEWPPAAGPRAPALGAGLSGDSALEVPIWQGCARPRARDLWAVSPGQPRASARVGGHGPLRW